MRALLANATTSCGLFLARWFVNARLRVLAQLWHGIFLALFQLGFSCLQLLLYAVLLLADPLVSRPEAGTGKYDEYELWHARLSRLLEAEARPERTRLNSRDHVIGKGWR